MNEQKPQFLTLIDSWNGPNNVPEHCRFSFYITDRPHLVGHGPNYSRAFLNLLDACDEATRKEIMDDLVPDIIAFLEGRIDQ
jgi:hypothetical protein